MKLLIFLVVCLLLTQAIAEPLSAHTIAEKIFSLSSHLMKSKTNNQSCTESCCGSLPSRGPQTYHYYQKQARFVGGSGSYAINTTCYSGSGSGLNNPDKQCVSNVGPLPATTYKLGYCKNTMHDPPVQRPCAFYLEPQKPSEMCGRSAFFIHGCACCTTGDDTTPPTAGCSAGCIVMNYANRRKLRVGDTIIVEHSLKD